MKSGAFALIDRSGNLFEYDSIYDLVIAVSRWSRRLRKLLSYRSKNTLVDDHHVLQVFRDGPAVRSWLESPLRLGESGYDLFHPAASLFKISEGLVYIGGLQSSHVCFSFTETTDEGSETRHGLKFFEWCAPEPTQFFTAQCVTLTPRSPNRYNQPGVFA